MLSKNQQKYLRQLGQKKYRRQHHMFLVQGAKNVLELLQSDHDIDSVFASESFLAQHHQLLGSRLDARHIHQSDEGSLSKVSTLVTNNEVIAVAPMRDVTIKETPWQLALDGVSDPGNLGTLIRLADWYGFSQILLSPNCADPYNPKVISATMGSFTRVSCATVDLPEYLQQLDKPVYGAFLGGTNVHHVEFAQQGVLVMGSESHGISEAVGQAITERITISGYGGAESLNVAIASGIILDNIKRCSG
ncbi:TrmH family RNA methyltransferase [Pseudoalteromonas ruthenica]|uniref:TrmH family RNA methyltransferase n=1 Tax=Pseudoalteromonas ruthenica TaxID=151081 RepID=UPI0003483CD1|nr:RNA methyltransferase [Pseudoalteromonas ruthenica]TMO43016.1 RNA methyltransferase [Pseudoalteromonas ruthenica]TMO48787.1 RNA methyltransferase [Pseudoalteromonas ruthenica]